MNRTCKMKHFCERESFNRRNAIDPLVTAFRYYIIDPIAHQGDPKWDDEDVSECVFRTDSREQAEAFIAQSAQRCELRDNAECLVCDMYDKRQADLKDGCVRPFYLVVEGTSRRYGGPEEGGWWYDWHEVLEVRRAFTLEQGLRHARELKDNYPQPKYNRFSAANRGEDDTRIVFCYGESDPRWPNENHERPRYE